MSAPDEGPLLFDREWGRVTPSWFTLNGTSHAMRTVVRLSLADRRISKGSWTLLFLVSLVLIVLAAFGLWYARMPWWLAFALFVGSIALALTSAFYAFVMRDGQRLDVVLSDGTRLVVEKPGRVVLTRLHGALTRAMDWHHGGEATRRTRPGD